MGFVTSLAAKAIRKLLATQGVALVRPKRKFGFDPFTDINRLAKGWNRPVSLVFDVGANNGDTALALLKEFRNARVWSFELHPTTFAQLTAKVGLNPRFLAFNLAFGTENREVEMFEYDQSQVNSLTPDAQFAKRFDKQAQVIQVQSKTLDDFCQSNAIDHIDVLKIDTEGFDLEVLRGCSSMLQRRAISFIYCEFNDLRPKEGTFGGALIPFDDLLRPYGYRFAASYLDQLITEGELFCVSNALFCLPPNGPAQ